MEGYRNLLAGLVLGSVILYGSLPWLGLNIFGSPDETAVYVVAERFSNGSSAAISDALAIEYPWLHPRSWLSHEHSIVPIGFLGWPWILSLIAWLSPAVTAWLGTFVVASSIIPLWFLLRRYPVPARFLAGLVYVTYPVLILYGNRSLFPNGALLSLGLWVLWLIYHQARVKNEPGRSWQFAGIGLLAGLCLAIRPVEALWIVPWWIYAGWPLRAQSRLLKWFGLGVLVALLPMLLHAQLAYGGFWKVGYNLRDNPSPVQIPVEPTAGAPKPRGLFDSVLPYGLHPSNIAKNTDSFFGQFLFPWTIVLLGGLAFVSWPYIKDRRRPHVLFWISAWTVLYLFIIYGSGLYADHVRPGAITLGNSFLRYLLPLAPFIAWASAEWWTRASSRRNARWLVAVYLVLLSAFGIYTGLARDDESVLALRGELLRYQEIRLAAATWFQPSDVIVSERSDKIFFPTYRAVSPIPPVSELGRLSREQGIRVGLFARPLGQSDKDAWRTAGLEPVELASYGRERLYLLRPSLQP